MNEIVKRVKFVTTTGVLFLASPRLMLAESEIGLKFSVKNPLSVDSISDFLLAILNIFIVVATPIIVLFIIYAGFLYVTAQGNAEQTKKATRAFTYAIIGGVILLGAVAVGEIIGNVIDSFTPEE